MVRLSAAGERVYRQLEAVQADWANRVAASASARSIADALAMLRQLRERLERARPTD
jgi:hypothetical protein